MSRNLLSCYLESNLIQCVWVYSYKIQEQKTSKRLFSFSDRCDREGSDVYHFSLTTSSLILNSSSIFNFQVWAVQNCILGKPFTAGLPARIIVWVGSLGRASMMLKDLKLVRTTITSLTRWSCAFFECMITIHLSIQIIRTQLQSSSILI